MRIALGALLIKEILGLSDREAVESVIENPYLQYFLGFKSFQTKAPFSAALLTHFRKRLPREVVMSLNDKIIELSKKSNSPEENPPRDRGGVPPENASAGEAENSGTILMDATCAPADIKYRGNSQRQLSTNCVNNAATGIPGPGRNGKSAASVISRSSNIRRAAYQNAAELCVFCLTPSAGIWDSSRSCVAVAGMSRK